MTTFKVEGMHCMGCVRRVKEALDALQVEGTVSLEEGTVTIACDDAAILLKARESIEDLGFDVL